MSAQWKVDDLDSDLNRLNHLPEAVCDIHFNLRIGETDTRVDSLLWIAREMSNGIMQHIEAHPLAVAS